VFDYWLIHGKYHSGFKYSKINYLVDVAPTVWQEAK
jgi:hypothetical protein